MDTCPNPPLFRYTWPGRDEAYACLDHALDLLAVADALDFHLQLIRCNEDEILHQHCSQQLEGEPHDAQAG